MGATVPIDRERGPLPPKADTASVRNLNDAFRLSFSGGRVLLTASIAELPEEERETILSKVRAFDAFDGGDDPYASTTLARSSA